MYFVFFSAVILFTVFTFNDAVPSSVSSDEDSRKLQDSCKILVTHSEVPSEALNMMSECQLTICETLPTNRSEILEKVTGVHGIFWSSNEALNAEILDAAGPQLKSISTMSAGIDHIDVKELQMREIPLGHTPTVLNDAVADLAIGLMLAAARRFHEGREKISGSQWENYHIEWMWGQDVRNSTVGFFGFGGIGKATGRRLQGFDINRILYTTRNPISEDLEKKFKASKVPFDELLAESDFLFISAPLTPETKGIFNSTAFAKMKKTAVLINTARGPIVNQEDLYKALETGQIFSAGIDVMTPEPLPANDKLLSLPNLVVTPHLGSSTRRTRTDMAVAAANNVLRGLRGDPMLYPAY